MDEAYWTSPIDLETPAGRMLRKLAAALPPERHYLITVFGSAPLQITVDPALLSGDVDLFSDSEDLVDWVTKAGLGMGQADFYIQVCSGLNFRTSPKWAGRTRSAHVGNCEFRFPHPMDILIGKLNRLDEKDLLAFRTVIARTGHPAPDEMIRELQDAVDLFRPSFDEEQGHDIANNCRRLWRELWSRPDFDPRAEIIAPALKRRREGYGEPTRDFKGELREAALAYKA